MSLDDYPAHLQPHLVLVNVKKLKLLCVNDTEKICDQKLTKFLQTLAAR